MRWITLQIEFPHLQRTPRPDSPLGPKCLALGLLKHIGQSPARFGFQAQLGWIVGPAILVRSRTSIGKTQIRPLSVLEPTLAFWRHTAHSLAMTEFERADYSVVVKHRDTPQNSWRWEIHRAGRSDPIKLSVVSFWSVATANRAGKEALKQLLDKLYS